MLWVVVMPVVPVTFWTLWVVTAAVGEDPAAVSRTLLEEGTEEIPVPHMA